MKKTLLSYALLAGISILFSFGVAHATEKTRTALQTEFDTYKLNTFNAGSDYDRKINFSDSVVFKQDNTVSFCRDVHAAETTDVATGTSIYTFRMPFAMTVTDVRVSVVTAGTTDTIDVDINEAGTSILSTVLTIDATEVTSTTAATPAVISDSSLADDALIAFDVDSADTGNTGQGLKACLIGRQT